MLLPLQARPIRLRNPVIPPQAPAASERAAASARVSGLYLIQFREALKPEWRGPLAAAGVELLRHVPDDAFVARLRGVSLAELQRLPFVEWAGPFAPQYKVHQSLRPPKGTAPAAGKLNVAVLLAPGAAAGEVATARGTLASVRQESRLRFGTVLRGQLNAAQLDALARSDAVLWIEPAADMKLFDEIASALVAGEGGPNELYTQSLGYDGAGVTVSVADTGLNNGDAETMHPDLAGRATEFFQYGTLTDAADEHSHGTHCAGIVAGDGATGELDENGFLFGLGVAPAARIVTQRIFDGVGNYMAPPSYETLTRDAVRAGAEIGSNSWGDDTQGRYDTSAMEFDALVRDADALAAGDQPYILEFSAGNAGPGPQTIGSPAVAKNVIATGASQNNRLDLFIYSDGPDAMADFSSRGPCEDGRIKPDICAPGTWIASLKSESATDESAWAPIDYYYLYMGGTSQAGPHASGAAAVFVQYYREAVTNLTPSPALVKAALINCAVDLDDASGTAPVPNMDEGWGRIDLTQIIGSTLRHEFVDQTSLLATAQVYERPVTVASADEALKITLAYTDVPGFPGALAALVNDLDLEVVAPDGTLYRGNRFFSGESVPNAATADRLNNVECVHLAEPQPGQYTVRIRAHSVPEDARADTGGVDQDFALVVSGDLALPGMSVVALDRRAYRVPGQIRVQVVDSDQAGSNSVFVTLRSTTESAGESYALAAAGAYGAFTGTVATATGPAAADGQLQIAHGNAIEAVYADVSAGANRVAAAVADFVAPVLTNVEVTNRFGQATISWLSDEPATSIVRYGTNASLASLTLAVTNTLRTTGHSLTLSGLVGGRTYYFYVASADEAGNTATNSNGGAAYFFVVAPTPPVLVVDEYIDPLFGAPPLAGYTNTLAQLGVSHDVWEVEVLGEPSLGTLQSYRAVIWRVPELTGGWSAAERLAISNYLHTGGSLLVASMEIFSRLVEVGGEAFITDVLQVASYATDETGSTGAGEVIGLGGAGGSLDVFTDFGVYDALWWGIIGPDLSDTITPTPRASAIFENDSEDVIGLRWPAVGQSAPGRLVLLTFPLDAVPLGSGVNDRAELLKNILAFLAPGASGLADVALDSSAYPLPGAAALEVGDADQAGHGTLAVTATTTTQTTPTTVTLSETAAAGVFTGSFEIIAATNAPVAGKLRAANGDTVTVQYLDVSAARTVSAVAVVDTVAPGLSNVVAVADYEEAVISWETTEPADALVQFGESAILNRTASSTRRGYSHAVTLPALTPDRTYYYRVVSRDAAGNTVVGDNGGLLYSFQTLTPLALPWFDSLDGGAANWSLFNADGSQSQWTLGVPDNGVETAAHSPPNAWGSNLNGDYIDYAESFLLGPALNLTGGNVATLRFWHSYDFTEISDLDILEYGQLLLFTNNVSAPVTLAQYIEFNGGWEEEEIDLSPYTGHVIYLVWNYELLSLDTRVRPGWLVDDISVTLSNVAPGTVRITNNLWQAPYVLAGPVQRTAKGTGTVITNAPPGQYAVTFGDVPYYTTPAPQTNSLVSFGTAVFQGSYTFADANTNGMSDLWEQAHFGGVSPGRTRFTDSDGDGASDYAEFMAGTDPASASSRFRITSFTRPGGGWRITWTSLSGRGYRVYGSTNLAGWAPASDWIQATLSSTSHTLAAPTNDAPGFFRVEVRP